MAFTDFRTRLFLITPAERDDSFSQAFASALSGGDIACLLIDDDQRDERAYMDAWSPYAQTAQDANIAVLVMDDTRLAGRLDADGVHFREPKTAQADEQTKLQERGLIVGTAGINTRHLALQTGERGFDYVFFGRTDRGATEDNHPKTENLALWWAEMMAIPCVALAGTSDEAFAKLANGGVEFIAVREQIWQTDNPGKEIARLNTMLDAIAHKRMDAAA